LSNHEGEFPTALRGYDRGSVDDAIRDLKKELLSNSTQAAQLAVELRETSALLAQAKQELAEVGEPSYAGVGAKAALILSSAEDIATRLVADAQAEKTRLLEETNLQIEELHGEAKGYYDALVAEAQRRVDRMQAQARADYGELMAKARNEAAVIVSEATREAGAIRGATATEVAKLRAAAKREVETTKTRVERDLAERKLIAQRDNTKKIDQEAAEALVSERARIDLELELTARRDEAEAEYLRKHQEAVATTQKYLDDANAQLSLALTRTNTARLEAETLEAAARSMTKSVTENARAKAEATIASAEAEARQIISDAHKQATLSLREAENRLRKIVTERDAIAGYLENLQALVDHAAKANKESE